jgi:hypothetical protein
VAHDFASYDLFMAGTGTGDPAETQLYGLHFSPFSIDRLSTDNRTRAFAADATHLLATFADGQVNKLAQVTSTGELAPIPGLGEPDALYPMLRDGVLYYGAADGDSTADPYRYHAWDLAGQHQTSLFSYGAGEYPKPAGDGRFALTRGNADGTDDLVVRDAKGQVARYPLHKKVGAVRVGQDYVAATTEAGGKSLPDGLILVNLTTGKTTKVPTELVLGWSPDGTRLLTVQLAIAADDTQVSRLALVDPAKPDAPPQVVGTIPFPVYEGVWVRGEPAS